MDAYSITQPELKTFGTIEFGMPFFEAVLQPKQQFQTYRGATKRIQAVHELLDRSVVAESVAHRFYSNEPGLSDSDLDELQLRALLGPGQNDNPSSKTHYAQHSHWIHNDRTASKALSTLRSTNGTLNLSTRIGLYLGALGQPLNTDELAAGLAKLGEYIPQTVGYMGFAGGPNAAVSEIVCDLTADLWFHLLEWHSEGTPKENVRRRELHRVEGGRYVEQFADITNLVNRLMEPKERFNDKHAIRI